MDFLKEMKLKNVGSRRVAIISKINNDDLDYIQKELQKFISIHYPELFLLPKELRGFGCDVSNFGERSTITIFANHRDEHNFVDMFIDEIKNRNTIEFYEEQMQDNHKYEV